MSAFKKLNYQDVFISDYVAKKQWEVSGSLVSSYGINSLRGITGSTSGYPYPTDYRNGYHEELLYREVLINFYTGSLGSGSFTGSFDLSLQTTLSIEGARSIQDEVAVISLPKDLYGTHIEPGSFSLKPYTGSAGSVESMYFEEDYCWLLINGENQYIENIGYWYGSNPLDSRDYLISESVYVEENETVGEYVDINRSQQSEEIIDDGEGTLIIANTGLDYTVSRRVVGDIIYNQGQIIITDPVVARYYSTYGGAHLKWKSNLPIYTYNVHCKIRDSELNFTYNTSATSGSNGDLASNVTGSAFTPYITTIGLYNDANELLAVAKTGRPIPKSQNTDMMFVVKIDI